MISIPDLDKLAHWAALERLSRPFMPEQAWIHPRMLASVLATVREVQEMLGLGIRLLSSKYVPEDKALLGLGIRLLSSEYVPEDKALLVDRDGNVQVIDIEATRGRGEV